ncbi:uncharacterized protein LOC135924019 [Gordionus sp. m RMFG-2023]|uniref:uncharacterized protein LOC135924019 n=1 Tax=Gordionus sp. m RMFG-2023 TaxID=3053472 RepID=UPI0031FD5544
MTDDTFCSPLFLIPKSDGTPRIISDFSNVSRNFIKYPFKLKTIPMIAPMLASATVATKIDLKSAFYSIPLAQSRRRFFGFGTVNSKFRYKTLPMGAGFSPYALQNIVLDLCAKSVKKANFSVYLDDIIIFHADEQYVFNDTIALLDMISAWGLRINDSKSVLSPTNKISYLGININFTNKTASVDKDNQSRLKFCQLILYKHSLQSMAIERNVALEVLGILNHYTYSITGLSRVFAPYYDTMLNPEDPPSIDYLKAYPKAVAAIDALMKPFPFTFIINTILHVDASSTHIGVSDTFTTGYSFTFDEAKQALGVPEMVTPHINQKELLAIWVGCKYSLNKFKTIPAIVTDSQVANLTWIPSENNLADSPSRTWIPSDEAHAILHGLDTAGLPSMEETIGRIPYASTPLYTTDEADASEFANNLANMERDFDPGMFERTLDLSINTAYEEESSFPEEHHPSQ